MDVDHVPFGKGDGGYALFLGRMCADKGPDRAIRVARAAGVPLVLAAKIWEPGEQRFFHETVEPMLGDDAVYIGETGGRQKFELLGGAVALLNPIRWPEPFGLVMIEALATGTPVLSFADGSAPEIVEHGVTGLLCDDEDDMIDALRHARDFDRAACRLSAVGRFCAERMVADHRRLYRAMADGRRTAEVIDLNAVSGARAAATASAERR
jgi:glycosyltransferase involved in cell wall biosynthesis